jgi:hypothetical protein
LLRRSHSRDQTAAAIHALVGPACGVYVRPRNAGMHASAPAFVACGYVVDQGVRTCCCTGKNLCWKKSRSSSSSYLYLDCKDNLPICTNFCAVVMGLVGWFSDVRKIDYSFRPLLSVVRKACLWGKYSFLETRIKGRREYKIKELVRSWCSLMPRQSYLILRW